MAANLAAAGEVGSACSAEDKCVTAEHCCGTATPAEASVNEGAVEVTGVCAVVNADGDTNSITDVLGNAYTHVCGAQKLLAAAAMVIATAYIM